MGILIRLSHADEYGHAEFESGMHEDSTIHVPIENVGNPLNLIPVADFKEKSILKLMQIGLSLSIILGFFAVYKRVRSKKRCVDKDNS